MASTLTKKRSRRKSSTPRVERKQRKSPAAQDEHLKELMKQAVREVLAEYNEEAWDRQIATDIDAGKLDQVIAAAREEIRQGKTEPLDPNRFGFGSERTQSTTNSSSGSNS